jgi:hypothetical protein
MGRKNNEHDVKRKFLAFGVRLTCYVSGKQKNRFMADQLKRDSGEGELIRSILDIHYSIVELEPRLKEMEHTELKKYLIKLLSDKF